MVLYSEKQGIFLCSRLKIFSFQEAAMEHNQDQNSLLRSVIEKRVLSYSQKDFVSFTAIAAEIGEPILAFRYIKLCFIDGEIQFPANTPFSRWLKVHLNLHHAPSLTLFV